VKGNSICYNFRWAASGGGDRFLLSISRTLDEIRVRIARAWLSQETRRPQTGEEVERQSLQLAPGGHSRVGSVAIWMLDDRSRDPEPIWSDSCEGTFRSAASLCREVTAVFWKGIPIPGQELAQVSL
jgi:hypothetical protein